MGQPPKLNGQTFGGVADKDIQAILHNSNIGITMNISMKKVVESQVDAMDLLGADPDKDSAFNLGLAGYTIALQ